MKNAQLLLVRHAESEFNVVIEDYMRANKYDYYASPDPLSDEEFAKMISVCGTRGYRDAKITKKGLKQCIAHQTKVNEFKLNPQVLVSPHKRTIETAVNMLATHPQKNDLVLKLEPNLKEALLSSGDVPCSAEELKGFVARTEAETGFTIDSSNKELREDTWMLNRMTPAYGNRIRKRVAAGEDFGEAVLTDFDKNGPELDVDIYARSEETREMLRKVAKKGGDPTIVFTHHRMLQAITSDGFIPEVKQGFSFVNSIKFLNCQVAPVFVNELGTLIHC
jgi:hypothetical protein